jgi:hypothetical protein
VIGKLGIEELDEAVAFVGTGDDGQPVTKDLEAAVPLLADQATFARWGCDETVDGSAVGGSAGVDEKGRAVGECDASEADDGRIEGGEVAA